MNNLESSKQFLLRVQQELIESGFDAVIVSQQLMTVQKPGLMKVGRQQTGWKQRPKLKVAFHQKLFYFEPYPSNNVEPDSEYSIHAVETEKLIKSYELLCNKQEHRPTWKSGPFRPNY